MFSNALHEDLMRLGLAPDRSLANIRKMQPQHESNRKILKATRVVRFPEFYEKAARVFLSIAKKISKLISMPRNEYEEIVLFVQPKKSNAWMAALFLDFLERIGMRDLILRYIVMSDLSEDPVIENAIVVFLDDGTYSGTQMAEHIDDYARQFEQSMVIVGVPFATEIAIGKIRRNLEKVSGETPSMIFYADLMEPLGRGLLQQKPAVYFDHKVPNSMSTYDGIYTHYLDPVVTRPFYRNMEWEDWMQWIQRNNTRTHVKLNVSDIPKARVVNIKRPSANRRIVTYDNLNNL